MASFLNTELILSIVQMAEFQMKAYTEFYKYTKGDKDEARYQTEIFMKVVMGSGNKPKEDNLKANTKEFWIMGEEEVRRISEEE